MATTIDISADLQQLLAAGSIEQALSGATLDEAAAHIESIIKLRTADGVFLNPEAPRSYLSEGWKRKRERRGLQVSHVDLFFEGFMLDAMRSRSAFESGIATIETGYLSGESEIRSMEIAGFHNTDGAGKNRVRREFVGLTDEEIDRVYQNLEKMIFDSLPGE